MDAKPQRFARALRPHMDENAPAVAPKVLHQRFKSTGALASAATTASLKGVAKRTAFAEISNVNRNVVRDDSTIGTKSPAVANEKAAAQRAEKPSAPLQRPAQRGNGVSKAENITAIARELGLDPALAAATAAAVTAPLTLRGMLRRPAAVKPDTTVYKDSQAHEGVPINQPAEKIPATISEDAESASTSEINRKDSAAIQDGSRDVRKAERQKDKDKKSEAADNAQVATVKGAAYTEKASVKVPIVGATTEPRVIDESAEVRNVQGQSEDKEAAKAARIAHPAIAEAHQYVVETYKESEAYGVDEEDEHYIDDDGYTTARSFRSRGDNTTGGAPTVIFPPRVTARDRRDIQAAKRMIEGSRTEEQLEEDLYDPSMVAEYSEEIFEYMSELENKMLPNPHYMDNQTEIQWSMRSILIDWLIQVHSRFTLLPETLFLSVNYIDRFLSCKVVSLGKLQLVGATALLIAAKYEEINAPSIPEMVYMVDSGYTIDEILKAERFMLSMLQFELGWPGPMSFLRRISKADDYDLDTRTLAKYFLEASIIDERFVGCPPSFMAAGAHCLARYMLKKGDWSAAHIYYSNYTFPQLRQLMTVLLDCCEDARAHHIAIYEKYMDRRYKRASLFAEAEMTKGFRIPDEADIDPVVVNPILACTTPIIVDSSSSTTTRN